MERAGTINERIQRGKKMLKKHKLIKCFYNIIQVGKYVMYSRSYEKGNGKCDKSKISS